MSDFTVFVYPGKNHNSTRTFTDYVRAAGAEKVVRVDRVEQLRGYKMASAIVLHFGPDVYDNEELTVIAESRGFPIYHVNRIS